jgi:hypothetical protein
MDVNTNGLDILTDGVNVLSCTGVIWIVHFRTAYRAKYRLLFDGVFLSPLFVFSPLKVHYTFHASWLSVSPSSIIVRV